MKQVLTVDLQDLWKALLRGMTSLLCAAFLYAVWLAAFLLLRKLDYSAVETILWLMAPIATATGFTVGISISERWTRAHRSRFSHIFVWALIGCTIGAGMTYWFGPMLIVFGMFLAGTASIAVREAVRLLAGRPGAAGSEH